MDDSTPRRWWHEVPHAEALSDRLAAVRAIDNHTHLLWAGEFRPQIEAGLPLGLRSTNPAYAAALSDRFGVATGPGGLLEAAREASVVRAALIERLGLPGYWHDHLDAAGVEIALVNQESPAGTDGVRLCWVAVAGDLLYPLPAAALHDRSPRPEAVTSVMAAQARLARLLGTAGLVGVPADLGAYVDFVDRTLAGWRERGAVALKFWDAYLRTLLFDDVPEARAQALYARGLATPLPREEYLALQDYLARHIFLQAGRLGLPVHLHSSGGGSPALRLQEADVRNLEGVLTDGRFAGTQFVLIHGGAPLFDEAAYLALKPHVWLDVSSLPFLYPVPDLARALRTYLLFAPEHVLFGTDAGPGP
ncbi:MAG TPA: amidohydrolase family protein, partial [Chloroflexota bacterium]|nr:amidohydrolase family protein [Chloroflexota bacterium]